MEKWEGKFAVVTGTSSGIGASLMKELSANKINVIALDLNIEKTQEISNNLNNGRIFPHKCDVSNFESIKETFEWISSTFGTISILINNAGVIFNIKLTDDGEEVSEKINKTIDTNFTGLVHMSRAAINLMKKSNDFGMIVNINSNLGYKIPFNFPASMNVYPPTKFAVTAFSEVLRQELITTNCDKIRVTNLSPSFVLSDLVVAGGFVKDAKEVYDNIPHLKPVDVANAVLYLLSTPENVNVSQLSISCVGDQCA